MTRKFTIFAIIALIFLPSVSLSGGIITSFRTSDKQGTSRFVAEISGKPEYKIFILTGPPRIVIDMPGASWNDFESAPIDTSLIEGVRHSNQDNILRIVLDLKKTSKIQKHFILPPEKKLYRLVVDITPDKAKNIPEPQLKNPQKPFVPTPKLKEVIKPVIAIDAGHGGHDPGAKGINGTKEKAITLSFAYLLKQTLEETGKYDVFLTRKDDTYIDLKKRVALAKEANANMFVSIHADSHNNHETNGLSIYTLSEKASDKEAEELARKENQAGVIGNVDISGDSEDVSELLIDLVQRETKNLSASFAENVIEEVKENSNTLYNPHRFAGFRVLTSPDIPSALVELGYLSNKKEEQLLLLDSHKKQLADAIVRAIDKHFKKYPVD